MIRRARRGADTTPAPGARGRRLGKASSVLVTFLVALTAGLGGGSAYAYWSTQGAAAGRATTIAPLAVTVVRATGTAASTLAPGRTADLLVAIDNPNSFPVTITAITQTGPAVGTGAGCVNTGVTVPGASGLALTVGSGSNLVVHIPAAAAMSSASDSGCQGGTFAIPVDVTVRR